MTDQQITTREDEDQIKIAFNQLLNKVEKQSAKLTTKQDEKLKTEKESLVENALSYTVETIVKGMADIHLDFNQTIKSVSEKLQTEINKLKELQLAIQYKSDYLEQIQNIRLAADALHLLNLENQNIIQEIEKDEKQRKQILEEEIKREREKWKKEQKEFDKSSKEIQESIEKSRKKEETEYQYKIEQDRKKDADDFEYQKKTTELKIKELKETKTKELDDREKKLDEQKDLLNEYREKVAKFDSIIEQEVKIACDSALNELEEDAKNNAELIEKEFETGKKIYEQNIKSLEETIKEQKEQIKSITNQYEEALKQVQMLAMNSVISSKGESVSTKRQSSEK